MEDRLLVQAWKRGDREGFETLMIRYEKPLYSMVRSMVMDREEARDITQQAFIRAFNGIHRLRQPERFKSWLFSIGANLARDHIRQRRPHLPLEEWDRPDRKKDPARVAAAKEDARRMRNLICALPPRQREVVSLRLFAEMSFAEIAEMLRIRQESARSSFHFGIKTLRNLFANEEKDEHEL